MYFRSRLAKMPSSIQLGRVVLTGCALQTCSNMVGEADVSQSNGGQLKAPTNPSVTYCWDVFQGFQGGNKGFPMMPTATSLSDGWKNKGCRNVGLDGLCLMRFGGLSNKLSHKNNPFLLQSLIST